MPESLRTPILDAVLREQDNIALILPRDIAKEPAFDMYFFRIARRFPLHRTYDEELSKIGAGGTIDFTYMGEDGLGEGSDILTVWEERPFRLLHFAFGICPGELWLYKSIPADTRATGWAYKTSPRVGDKRDYIPGYLSPYDNPTIATETILYHKLSIQIGLKNSAGRAIRPSLRLLGAGYDTMQIVDQDFINAMIAGVKPVRPLTVGSLQMFSYMVPEKWEPPTKVTADVVAGLMARR